MLPSNGTVTGNSTSLIFSNSTSAIARNKTDIGFPETSFEYETDLFIGALFLATTVVAARRMIWSRERGGAETTVVTAFYSLILMTSALRSLWFLIPRSLIATTYTPTPMMAFDPNVNWGGAFFSQILVSAGSLCLFSIFILILVYWADILKKYFFPGARRNKPMATFLILVGGLALVQIFNAIFFLLGFYSSEAMMLVNAVPLAIVSIICVCEITIFSQKFRTVLMTLGAINQVSTESQVKRIMWITVTGNLFFVTRSVLELIFAASSTIWYFKNGNLETIFSHKIWDIYVWIKYVSEVAILCLMLYILQSRFTKDTVTNGGGAYSKIPDAQEGAAQNNPNSYEPLVV
mmetsp:Transcript_5002/g.5663  ORF Transcript_5002/g.5663 Transcript_5002/m.5663 type:complete len:349 (+) Transcript_5002:93-1139(+)